MLQKLLLEVASRINEKAESRFELKLGTCVHRLTPKTLGLRHSTVRQTSSTSMLSWTVNLDGILKSCSLSSTTRGSLWPQAGEHARRSLHNMKFICPGLQESLSLTLSVADPNNLYLDEC